MSRLNVTFTGNITNSQQKTLVKGRSEHCDGGTKVGEVLQLFSSAFFTLFFPYTPTSLHTLSKEIFPEK